MLVSEHGTPKYNFPNLVKTAALSAPGTLCLAVLYGLVPLVHWVAIAPQADLQVSKPVHLSD